MSKPKHAFKTDDEMQQEHLVQIREDLIKLRDGCLTIPFDSDGAVILSHAIRWLSFKVDGKPYEPPTD